MDLISEHIYRKELADVDAHSRQLADDIDRIALAHRSYRRTIPALKGANIRIAMDEWNYWYGPYVYGELGVQYHLKDALGIAQGAARFLQEQRRLLHGELRADGERHRCHQDVPDGCRIRHHGAGPEALPPPVRIGSRRGHGCSG